MVTIEITPSDVEGSVLWFLRDARRDRGDLCMDRFVSEHGRGKDGPRERPKQNENGALKSYHVLLPPSCTPAQRAPDGGISVTLVTDVGFCVRGVVGDPCDAAGRGRGHRARQRELRQRDWTGKTAIRRETNKIRYAEAEGSARCTRSRDCLFWCIALHHGIALDHVPCAHGIHQGVKNPGAAESDEVL